MEITISGDGELLIATYLVIGAALCVAIFAYWGNIKMLFSPKLTGVRGGVWIRRTTGSRTSEEAWAEEALAKRGMILFDLKPGPVEDLQKRGEWSKAIASENIDVAVVGYTFVEEGTVTREGKPVPWRRTTLNVRFYGEYGQIFGAFTKRTFGNSELLIPEMVSSLARCFHTRKRSQPIKEEVAT